MRILTLAIKEDIGPHTTSMKYLKNILKFLSMINFQAKIPKINPNKYEYLSKGLCNEYSAGFKLRGRKSSFLHSMQNI